MTSASITRIIPAYAGSTRTCAAGGPPARDHPRIRGEHVPAVDPCCWGAGSSPHTRGAHRVLVPRVCEIRIIPAYAGSTGPGVFDPPRGRDHPRIRGEHLNRIKNEMPAEGSSPHTRGAPRDVPHITPSGRIIPAYAGSTGPGVFDPPRGRDHPRIRGEHPHCLLLSEGGEGSSPHTRGAQKLGDAVGGARGIIPAYAGSTPCSTMSVRVAKDHPRIRGEHILPSAMCAMATGSSPHTRGAQLCAVICGTSNGIIPAYAGSTCT